MSAAETYTTQTPTLSTTTLPQLQISTHTKKLNLPNTNKNPQIPPNSPGSPKSPIQPVVN